MVVSLLRSFFLSLCLSLTLIAQSAADAELQEIAAITGDAQRYTALQGRLSKVESLNGRLLLLGEAVQFPSLQKSADRMRFDLLLLSGRTEEAAMLLEEGAVEHAEMAYRLALVHGERTISESSPETGAGLTLSGIDKLSDSVNQTPESFALRRGMLISTGLLFSPYAVRQAANPATEHASQTGEVRIQVGAFSTRKNARDHLRFLEERGVSDVIIIPAESGGRSIYKTVITGIAQADLQRELVRLKERGIEGFILN